MVIKRFRVKPQYGPVLYPPVIRPRGPIIRFQRRRLLEPSLPVYRPPAPRQPRWYRQHSRAQDYMHRRKQSNWGILPRVYEQLGVTRRWHRDLAAPRGSYRRDLAWSYRAHTPFREYADAIEADELMFRRPLVPDSSLFPYVRRRFRA